MTTMGDFIAAYWLLIIVGVVGGVLALVGIGSLFGEDPFEDHKRNRYQPARKTKDKRGI